jgi:putative transposase
MRKSKFSESEKLEVLAKWDAGAKIEDLCREYQISTATLYKWRKDKADEEDDTKRKLKKLKEDNDLLRKMYADLSMDHEILKEGYAMLKKWQAQDAKKK